MKFVERIFDRLRPLFGRGPMRVVKPLFDATELFLLSPPDCTPGAPHVRDPASVKRYMSTVMIAVMPCIAASVYFFGLRMLAMIAVTYAAGLFVEVLFAWARKEEINEGFFVTGLLYPMILPPNLPLWMVAAGIVFGVVVGKELFGGTGRNLFNPALVGRCFLALGYSKEMTKGYWAQPGSGLTGNVLHWSADAVSGATPLGKAMAEATEPYVEFMSLLWGNVSGCAGETCAVAILLGAALLLITGIASFRTVLAAVIGFVVLGWVLNVARPAHSVPIHWHIFAGGFLFGIVFMATDPVTSPITNAGKWVYGLLIGALTILIRTMTLYVEGIMFAILLGNIAAPLLDEVVFRCRIRRLKRER